MAELFEALPERLVDAVPNHIKETVRAARFADAVRDVVGRGAQVDERQAVHGERRW